MYVTSLGTGQIRLNCNYSAIDLCEDITQSEIELSHFIFLIFILLNVYQECKPAYKSATLIP